MTCGYVMRRDTPGCCGAARPGAAGAATTGGGSGIGEATERMDRVSRVIAGSAGGRRLAVPPGRGTRPTSDRAREGIFSTVGSLIGPLEGCRVLDLYAGSGRARAGGALPGGRPRAPRGVRRQGDPDDQAEHRRPSGCRGPRSPPTGSSGCCQRPRRAPGQRHRRRRNRRRPYDLVLADPPYALGAEEVDAVLGLLRDRGWLAEDALVAVERESRGKDLVWPPGYEEERVRRYGEASVWYGRAAGNP